MVVRMPIKRRTTQTRSFYDQRESISVSEAVRWATEQTCAVTLYIYDEGDGTTVRPDASQIH